MTYKEAQRSLKEEIWQLQAQAAYLSEEIEAFEKGYFHRLNIVVAYSEKNYSPETIERIFKEQVKKTLEEYQENKRKLKEIHEWISDNKAYIRINFLSKYTGLIFVLRLFGYEWIAND